MSTFVQKVEYMDNNKIHLGEGAILGNILQKFKLLIKDNSVTTSKLADNAVTTGKIANSAISPDKLSSEVYSYLGNKIGVSIEGYSSLTISFDESTGMLYFEAT